MKVETYNPYTGERLAEYSEASLDDIRKTVAGIRKEQKEWAGDVDARLDYLRDVLRVNLRNYEREMAESISLEMGKPITQSLAEVRKCVTLVDYYLENSRRFLAPEQVRTDAEKSYVRFDPLGVIELIMPWNYPLWQVMRAAVPALVAGNGVMLKHASIVSGTSLLIERVMDTPLFKSVIASGDKALEAIGFVDGVSFTGSTSAGMRIAEAAGREIKKAVLELGGSDPFIVLESADLGKTARHAAFGRLQNAGQSCIASKRFLVAERIFDDFRKEMEEQLASARTGSPLDEKTFLGPLSSRQQSLTVKKQLDELKKIGKVSVFGDESGNFIPPSIAVLEGSYSEEVFGPVAILKKFRTADQAIKMANETPFGLGCSIWGDSDEAEKLVPEIEAGMVFVNRIVASDPRLPFGGVKKSGFGRELSHYGLLEFTNIRTVWIEGKPQ